MRISLALRVLSVSAALLYLLLGHSLNAYAATPAANNHKQSQAADFAKSMSKLKITADLKEHNQTSRSECLKLINNALSLVGVPYVFGGTTCKGFDCSGFTQYVFKGSGVPLPRTSSEQCTVGLSVSRDGLQAGDLVFFHTYAEGASHVGIYIGGGHFIHASKNGVQVANLADNYYAERYLGARRIQ